MAVSLNWKILLLAWFLLAKAEQFKSAKETRVDKANLPLLQANNFSLRGDDSTIEIIEKTITTTEHSVFQDDDSTMNPFSALSLNISAADIKKRVKRTSFGGPIKTDHKGKRVPYSGKPKQKPKNKQTTIQQKFGSDTTPRNKILDPSLKTTLSIYG